MKIPAMTAIALVLGVSACVHNGHTGTDVVHDDELTAKDFDDTVDYSIPDGVVRVPPPVPVHEFDEDVAAGRGAEKVIDGPTWLNADDAARNTLISAAAVNAPVGTTFVLEVASGAVWKMPPGGDLISSGVVREWSADEYWNLPHLFITPPPSPVLTKLDFADDTALARVPGMEMPYVIHDVGPVGKKEIEAAHGIELVMPVGWLQAAPGQRALELQSVDTFLAQLPAFQGKDNQPAFGVAIPSGRVYAIPERGYDNLVDWGSLRPWTREQIGMLPDVKSGTDRPIRSVPVTLDFKL